MWQRFTERAKKTVFFAQEEAGRLGFNHVATEHLLLGLLRENDSTAVVVLKALHLSEKKVRSAVGKRVTPGKGRAGPDMTLTPYAKRVIELAFDEARQLGNSYIGTEHILLGLIAENQGLAGEVLRELNITIEQARAAVLHMADNSTDGAAKGTIFESFLSSCTERLRAIVSATNQSTLDLTISGIPPEHMLFAILRDKDNVASFILTRLEVNVAELSRRAQSELSPTSIDGEKDTAATLRAAAVKRIALAEMRALKDAKLGTSHVLLGLTCDTGLPGKLLAEFGVTSDAVRAQISLLRDDL